MSGRIEDLFLRWNIILRAQEGAKVVKIARVLEGGSTIKFICSCLAMLNVQSKMRNFNIRANHARLFEVQQARGKYCWATHLKLAPLAVKGFSANTTNNFNPQWLQSQHIPPFGGVENDEMLFQNKIIKACAWQSKTNKYIHFLSLNFFKKE